MVECFIIRTFKFAFLKSTEFLEIICVLLSVVQSVRLISDENCGTNMISSHWVKRE